MENSKQNFIINLKKLLKENNLSTRQFAQNIGYPSTTFYSWLKGKGSPSYDALEKIQEYFKIDSSKLYSTPSPRDMQEFSKTKKSISDKLQKLLDDNNLTPTQFAKDINVQPNTVINWINGTFFPKPKALETIAKYFSIKVSDLFSEEDTKAKPNIDISNIKGSFADKLSKLLEAHNITPTSFARDINHPKATVFNWVKSVNFPKTQSLETIADYFNVAPADLLRSTPSSELVPLDIEIVANDYFPLRYAGIVSAGSFEEFMEAEQDCIVYVPIKYQGMRKRLHAFKVNGESMNKIIPEGAIVVVHDLLNNARKPKNGDIVVAFHDGEATVKRFFEDEKYITLSPDSTYSSFKPIILSKEHDTIQIIGTVIWFSNPDDIMDKIKMMH